ncbi:craniofacial development protein 2-like [Pundamilia nyererei]|uniref:Craniofacial development protein 2-like n=1 Tax=Pundamilia nyererei TaxID=303518 RepID=A0A9Y6MC59_9CICH|nr:PREDICTED: craniofacial development protein 2-like [Pundamilia nyererei]
MGERVAAALVSWRPVSEQLIVARFISTHEKTTVIEVCAPTEDTDDMDKNAFYDELQMVLDEVHRHDIVILMCDFNAEIGPDRNGFEQMIGPHGSAANTNDNGLRLTSFCAANNLCVGNSYFHHKQIHKKTWKSPGGLTANEIDYICISRRWRSATADVVTRRGADVGSDHYLVMAKLQLRLKRTRQDACRVRPFDVAKLKDCDFRNRYNAEIRNRFAILNHRGSRVRVQ